LKLKIQRYIKLPIDKPTDRLYIITMKLSSLLNKSAKIMTNENLKKIQAKYEHDRLLGKKIYGLKKLNKQLYA